MGDYNELYADDDEMLKSDAVVYVTVRRRTSAKHGDIPAGDVR